ncbi:hypothetical protein CHARACLAT_018902 [Characodon lateralis]|uniref:Uncharacterized protein n=1 Tax=Characodon lateralis TaxID=208331 RepID=A0ABU7EVG1_9TELE|nr:hypothetical protein [Characodon lateralis]
MGLFHIAIINSNVLTDQQKVLHKCLKPNSGGPAAQSFQRKPVLKSCLQQAWGRRCFCQRRIKLKLSPYMQNTSTAYHSEHTIPTVTNGCGSIMWDRKLVR